MPSKQILNNLQHTTLSTSPFEHSLACCGYCILEIRKGWQSFLFCVVSNFREMYYTKFLTSDTLKVLVAVLLKLHTKLAPGWAFIPE